MRRVDDRRSEWGGRRQAERISHSNEPRMTEVPPLQPLRKTPGVPRSPRPLVAPTAGCGEALLDAAHEEVADLAVGVQPHLARALDQGGVGGVPELELGCRGAGELDGAVLGFGG